MANLAVCRILVFGSILAIANSAKCTRSPKSVICENADTGVIERLGIYYKNDSSLIVRNSSVPSLKSGMFAKLKFVQKLSLTRCGIRNIDDGAFDGLKLTHLNLARNSIEDISDNMFAALPGLKFFDLSHNLVSDLKLMSGVGYSPVLKYVDVSNNRLRNLNLAGNFSELESINFENNNLMNFQTDFILHLPKIKEVFFDGNSLNNTYERFAMFILSSCHINIDFEKSIFEDVWETPKISGDGTGARRPSNRSAKADIERDFKLSPELIKSLSPTELTNLVERILTLRNFTANERNMLEMDRQLIREESKTVKDELTRIDQVIKRYEEVSREAKQESIGEYIKKSCEGMPTETWWQRFKRWKCKKLFNWVNRLISR